MLPPLHPRVKICGVRDAAIMNYACACGADAIGFVFAPSPRMVTASLAASIAAQTPPFIARVGVFAGAVAGEVRRVLEQCPLDYLQFHGGIPEQFWKSSPLPVIEAISVGNDFDVTCLPPPSPSVCAYLFDSRVAGSGQTFRWACLNPDKLTLPFFIAGGLSAENIDDAVQRFLPYGVDVSSGVETAPGVKSPQKIARFLAAVQKSTRSHSRIETGS